ncbi:hypothetical protein PG985_011600 [Apiospora marii]|uniref:Uncharacterized protein n=1 Tax=Apiospora marii TaxID=335849 RepID=A0ABR1R2F9_9PEZI
MCTVIIDVYLCKHCKRAVGEPTRREPSWEPCGEKNNYSSRCKNYKPIHKYHYEDTCYPGTGCQAASSGNSGGSSGDFSFAEMHYSARR